MANVWIKSTCNMSRIDNATLNLTLTQNTVKDKNTSAVRPCKVKVFAINYNVLRIMSGMGGLISLISMFSMIESWRTLRNARPKKLQATTIQALVVGKSFAYLILSGDPKKYQQLVVVLNANQPQHNLLIEKLLTLFLPRFVSNNKLAKKTLGYGKNERDWTTRILIDFERYAKLEAKVPETERLWVDNEGLSNLNRLKIQSALQGNSKDKASIQQLNNQIQKHKNVCCDNLLILFQRLKVSYA